MIPTTRLKLLALLIAVCSPVVVAGWNSLGNYESHTFINGNELTLRSGPSLLRVTILSADVARVRLAPGGTFPPDQSWAVVNGSWPGTEASLQEETDRFILSTSHLKIIIRKFPLRIAFEDKQGNILNEDEPSKGMSWNEHEVMTWKRMPADEYYFGFGEKAGRLMRKYTHMTMWNSDIPAYRADTDPLYESIPFFMGIRKGHAYGIFFDNSCWSTFDMGKSTRDQYSFGAEDGEINYYFFAGPLPRDVLMQYCSLVGKMPLPPRWALGYQQCRWSYPSEQRVREIARGFRERKIPCDVIYLDIDYMDGYRIFTWNKKNFPDPAGMIKGLSLDGFKIAVIVDPGIKVDSLYSAYKTGLAGNHFLKYPDGRIFIGKVWPGECAFPDFTRAQARAWWGEQFPVLVDAGVRGWWNDMNEPSVFDVPTHTVDLTVLHDDNNLHTSHAKNHNVYGMEMTQATYEGVRKLRPNERPFVLTRASYAGGQRYSAAWTGDNVSTWEHLQMVLPMCLNLSISGQPFVGSDIGGFMGYPSGELFARWLQVGVFTPLMRAHSVINEKNKEPWEYGDEFTAINRQTINLRYQLLPYIYDAMYEASVSGIPPMRPLAFEFPADERFIWNDDEFMFGDDLLIAPVLQEGQRNRDVALPNGEWFDYWTGKKQNGGGTITVDAPLDRLPIFVRGGAIIPTQQIVQYSDQTPINPLTLTIYPSSDKTSTINYEDDGHSFEYEGGKYFKQTITQRDSSNQIRLTFFRPEGSYRPPARTIVLRYVNVPSQARSVTVNGKELHSISVDDLSGGTPGWTYSPTSYLLQIRLKDLFAQQEVVVSW